MGLSGMTLARPDREQKGAYAKARLGSSTERCSAADVEAKPTPRDRGVVRCDERLRKQQADDAVISPLRWSVEWDNIPGQVDYVQRFVRAESDGHHCWIQLQWLFRGECVFESEPRHRKSPQPDGAFNGPWLRLRVGPARRAKLHTSLWLFLVNDDGNRLRDFRRLSRLRERGRNLDGHQALKRSGVVRIVLTR